MSEVHVFCKIENGIILQVQVQQPVTEPTPTGPIKSMKWVKSGTQYTIQGPNYPNGQIPVGFKDRPTVVGGYAITSGIPEDVWNKWAEQNEQLVASELIFAHESLDIGRGLARDRSHIVSGLEALKPDGDHRAPRSFNSNVTNVAIADEQLERNRKNGVKAA